jgi:uncharacterized protein (TIGR02647 family)
MSYTPENIAALDLLMLFNSLSGLEGLKIHKTAESAMIGAAQRLFDGGFITQVDGGYLTPLGIQAAEHAHALYALLNSATEH